MSTETERVQILEMLDQQQITVEQAVELLAAIAGDDEAPEVSEPLLPVKSLREAPEVIEQPRVEPEPAPQAASSPEPVVEEPPAEQPSPASSFDAAGARWRSWWWIPMGVGVTITVAGALFMYLAWQASGLGFWFVAACLPFLLGVILMALAWASRKSRWLHIRIQQPEGESPQRIAISIPLPLRPLAWLAHVLRPFIPQLQRTSVDELLLALETTKFDQPLHIQVDEGEQGDRVEVYYG
ncbi:MAG: hypothetical protein MUC85_06110 [Anaerolineales bacterium]|jgi:hypothetical protein|nr:hypothetical protein [Anaerolineales bacterium]